MANQPKNYKKFVATAATATLVASAIVPVASAASFSDIEGNTHADAIKALSDAGIIKGYEDGTFKPNVEINRGQTVKLLGRWLETKGYKVPENWNTVQRFNDLPVNAADQELVKYAALVKDAGVFNGSNGNLNYSQPMQRQQMAVVLVRAIDKVEGVDLVKAYKDANFQSNIKDLNKAFSTENVEAITALEYAGITVVQNFNPTSTITRGQFASFLYRTINEIQVETKVESVEATSATTLKVTGTGLKALKAEDITVEGNKVAAVQSTDGKTATVTLEGTLPPNTDVKVTIKDAKETKEFTVKYNLAPKTVAIQEATFDDDTKGQKLTVLVDGVATSVDYLLSAGYTVTFNAWDKDGKDATTTVFGSNTNGVLDVVPTDAGEYTVQVVIAKGSTILTSEKAKITIKNLDNAASAINSYELKNVAGFVQNSSTLVIGESATLTSVEVAVGSSVSELSPGQFDLKSSNENVVSVNSTTGTITANGLGTATVTITVGKVSKDVTITVKGETRKPSKATPESNAVKAIVGGSTSVKVKVTDQYGDPFKSTNSGVFAHYPTSVDGLPTTSVELNTNASTKGEATVSLAGVRTAGQSGTVLLKNANDEVLGSFTVTTTAVNNVATYKLAYDSTSLSKDDTINADIASDSNIVYKLSQYTSENVYNGDVSDLTGYKVKFNKDIIAVNGNRTGDYTLTGDSTITVTPVKAGSTTFAIYKPDGTLLETRTITVNKAATKITGVSWKSAPVINYSTTINYKTVLDITEGVTGTDDIVKGLTLSSPVPHNIRIAGKAALATGFNNGDLYIDKNDNGKTDPGDIKIGSLKFTATAASTGSIASASGDGYIGIGVTVGTTAKGSIIFSIVDETSSDRPVVSTTAVSVDVK